MKKNKKAMDAKSLVAIDFASTGIRALAAEVLDDRTLRILSDELRKVDGIKNGIISQASGTAFNVSALLKELQNSAGLHESIRELSAAVGGKGMRIVPFTSRNSFRKSTVITPELIDKMAQSCEKEFRQEGLAVYDVIPLSYKVDGREMEKPEGQKANEIIGNYHLVVGNELIKKQMQKCMERIHQSDITFTPIAAEAFSLAVSTDEEREEGCAVINFGHTSTTLAIYKQDILQHLMVIPLGSYNITKDIEETGISEESAEKLKCLKGVCMEHLIEKPMNIRIANRNPDSPPIVLTDRFVALIIEARLDEMMEPILRELKGRILDLPHGIILTGGGAKLGMLKEYMEERTGIYIRHGDHTGWLSADSDPKYADPGYSQVIGTLLLAHAASQSEELEHNRKQEEAVEDKKKPTRRRFFGEALSQGIFRFFEDDTDLQRPKAKA
ncbi:MAG: hypothetical protein BGP01_12060 [Paludibacter sp. 47-17]|nr:MAG: hypothetical protein ABS72_03460 [Paludibacter sp. SCN 50-10]OJX91154.1 MAG: hypothetical protein BGP01_12060 [Paludibacter sp. 47-17]